jgi:hypothetical protein
MSATDMSNVSDKTILHIRIAIESSKPIDSLGGIACAE